MIFVLKLFLVAAGTNPAAARPRVGAQQSIPGLLNTFQSEWDALVLECYNLKQQLHASKQELSRALYHHDAATRVIARIMKERDQYKTYVTETALPRAAECRDDSQFCVFSICSELESLRARHTAAAIAKGDSDAMDVDAALPGLSAENKNKIATNAKELSTSRKARAQTTSPSLTPVATIQQFKQQKSAPVHQASAPGILALDVHPHPERQHLIATGGVDKTAVVFNVQTEKKEATLSGHTKSVIAVRFQPDSDSIVHTASQDGTARVFRIAASGAAETVHVFQRVHKGALTSLDVHATNAFTLTTSVDRSWAIHDIQNGKTLVHTADPQAQGAINVGRFHPDGLILATGGEDSEVRVWDVRSNRKVASFPGYSGACTDITFNENGFYLATASEDRVIKVWDLRGPTNVGTLSVEAVPSSLSYDYSGRYLAAAVGNEIRVFNRVTEPPKEGQQKGDINHFAHVQTFDDHTKDVTCVRWGADAKFIASASMDRTLKVFM
jgi:pre-mRNA-processing factor 19